VTLEFVSALFGTAVSVFDAPLIVLLVSVSVPVRDAAPMSEGFTTFVVLTFFGPSVALSVSK
jgi:hypothetical protein